MNQIQINSIIKKKQAENDIPEEQHMEFLDEIRQVENIYHEGYPEQLFLKAKLEEFIGFLFTLISMKIP